VTNGERHASFKLDGDGDTWRCFGPTARRSTNTPRLAAAAEGHLLRARQHRRPRNERCAGRRDQSVPRPRAAGGAQGTTGSCAISTTRLDGGDTGVGYDQDPDR
jgi:hypothetical protein